MPSELAKLLPFSLLSVCSCLYIIRVPHAAISSATRCAQAPAAAIHHQRRRRIVVLRSRQPQQRPQLDLASLVTISPPCMNRVLGNRQTYLRQCHAPAGSRFPREIRARTQQPGLAILALVLACQQPPAVPRGIRRRDLRRGGCGQI